MLHCSVIHVTRVTFSHTQLYCAVVWWSGSVREELRRWWCLHKRTTSYCHCS